MTREDALGAAFKWTNRKSAAIVHVRGKFPGAPCGSGELGFGEPTTLRVLARALVCLGVACTLIGCDGRGRVQSPRDLAYPSEKGAVPNCASQQYTELVIGMVDSRREPNIRREAVSTLLSTGGISIVATEPIPPPTCRISVQSASRRVASELVVCFSVLQTDLANCGNSPSDAAGCRDLARAAYDKCVGPGIEKDQELKQQQVECRAQRAAYATAVASQRAEQARQEAEALDGFVRNAKLRLENIRPSHVDPAVHKSWCEADLVIELDGPSRPSVKRATEYTLQPNSDGQMYIEARVVK